jgi:hypothetical protein
MPRAPAVAMALIVSIAVSTGSLSAKVSSLTGDDFLKYCVTTKPSPGKDDPDGSYVAHCWGYFVGSLDTIVMLAEGFICLPKATEPREVIMTTYNWLLANPRMKTDYLPSVMFEAMRDKWPCKD